MSLDESALASDKTLQPESAAAIQRLARVSGDDFLREVALHVRRKLDVDAAFVSELCGAEWERVRTLAVATRDGLIPDFEYELAGTPCEQVADDPCVFPARARELFPQDPYLQAWGVESYAGVPLFDSQGRPLGLFGCCDCRPMPDGRRVLDYLLEFSGRVATQLSHRRALAEVREILESSSAAGSSASYGQLARSLAHALHARSGLVTELVPGQPARVRLRGVCVAGAPRTDMEGVELPLAGSPCEHVFERGWLFHPRGVAALYPDFAPTTELLGGESYVGLVFRDRAGQPLGHVAVFHDHPMREDLSPQALLRFFALWAAGEVERERAAALRIDVERKHLAAQRIESLGLFAGGIAHDFNNLLVGILGNASLALEEARGSAAVQAHLAEIETAARRAAELANQLLAYSGKGRFIVTDVDLNVLAEEMGQLLHTSIGRRVGLRFELRPDLPEVRGDATQLRQVLMNLVLNAADAIGDGLGVVTVRTGVFDADETFLAACAVRGDAAPGIYAALEVADTGCGMDAATRARIFDPFFTTKFTGRGLGLSAVQGIVRSHRGALWIQSEKGRGSTFRVLFPPALPIASLRGDPPAETPLGAGSGLVLVVEDEELVRRSAVRMLVHLGFQALEAQDGHEAVDLLRTHGERIDAVLLDMTMPRMDGAETFAALRALRPDLPVVLMSGYDERETLERFPRESLAGFLRKPFVLADMAARMRNAIAARRHA
jgi:signal transduction histidine kinase/CheY-like chemotaxis protein